MIISYKGEDLNVRRVQVKPSAIKEHDLIVMDSGLVECVSVARANRLEDLSPFLQFLFETESGARFPVHNLSGQFEVLRSKR